MSKRRKHILTLHCAVEDCKESTFYSYDSKRDYNEAIKRYKDDDYRCLYHSYENVSADSPRFDSCHEYIIRPQWRLEKYVTSWHSDTAFAGTDIIKGNDWNIRLDDLPLGTKLVVETTVRLSIPSKPDSMPDWKGLKDFGGTRQRAILIEEYNDFLVDADFVVLINNGTLLVGQHKNSKRSLLSRNLEYQPYREPMQEEKEQIQHSFSYIGRGSHVLFKYWLDRSTFNHNMGEQNMEGTLLGDSSWCKYEILGTDGRTYKVFKGWVSAKANENGVSA